MNNMINLNSMAADSKAALKKLSRDLKDLKKLLEVRALRENSRGVIMNRRDLPDIDSQQFSS
ncbi:MAG: hypothetical protein H7Y43_02505 [Akkermansiaceae bacterium]|nr:hypothetical protein [Verrucomicrobiales bacterium]